MYAVVNPTIESMRLKTSYVQDGYLDGSVLATMISPSVHEPFRFLGIKWMVKEKAAQFVCHRDVVYVESTGVTKNASGEEIGYHLYHSVSFPSIRELHDKNFIRAKIAEIVKDPETARMLTPHDLYAKRPLCNTDYYATFNRPNVTLVDVKANPIREITETGVVTEDGVLHELDVLVFATGFDAVDGCYKRVDIRGRGGLAIADHWVEGPASYLGILNAHYPNMFRSNGSRR